MGHALSIGPRPAPQTTVIIPTYNESSTIARTLTTLRARTSAPVHVIVSDGGSTDDTPKIARRHGAQVLHVTGGRARQQNFAARFARSPYILFLHADTLVPPRYDAHIARVLSTPGVKAGAFRLSVDDSSMPNALSKHLLHIVVRAANWRSRFLQCPYGDQGFFFEMRTFDRIGGFPDLPFLEDYEMSRRVARLDKRSTNREQIGHRNAPAFALSDAAVVTSARRYEALGVVRTTAMNQAVITAYHLGVPVPALQRWYRAAFVRARSQKKRRRQICITPQCP